MFSAGDLNDLYHDALHTHDLDGCATGPRDYGGRYDPFWEHCPDGFEEVANSEYFDCDNQELTP